MYIKVQVNPGAKKERVQKIKDDQYLIDVREKAERGMANRRIVQIATKIFDVKSGGVRIVSGHKNQSKIISIPD